MRKKKQDKIKLALLILLVCITLGYAALRTGLNINGTANVSGSSWNVHFANYQMRNTTNITPTTEPVITGTTTTSISYEVDLEVPGDLYEFTVQVVNSGSMDANISLVYKYNGNEIGQGNQVPAYITYAVTDENGDEIVDGHRLNHNDSETVKVYIKYRDDDASILPGTDVSGLSFDIEIDATQAEKEEETLSPGTVAYYDPVSTSACNANTYDPTAAQSGTSTCYKWYVLSNNGSDVELYLDHSIGSSQWISDEDYGAYAKNDKGPITALKTLKEATNDWTRVNLLNYSQEFLTRDYPTAMRTPGSTTHYDSFTCTNGTCVNDDNFQIATGMRARLISAEEIVDLVNDAINYDSATLSISETWGVDGGYWNLMNDWEGYLLNKGIDPEDVDLDTPEGQAIYQDFLSDYYYGPYNSRSARFYLLSVGSCRIGTYDDSSAAPYDTYNPLSWLGTDVNGEEYGGINAWTITPTTDTSEAYGYGNIMYDVVADGYGELVPVIKVPQSDITLAS